MWNIPAVAKVAYIALNGRKVSNMQYASDLRVNFEKYLPRLRTPITYGTGDIHFPILF